MSGLNRKNNFFWLTIAMIGFLVTGAFSRDLPSSMAVEIFQVCSVVLLLVSLFSLKAQRNWTRYLVVVVGLMVLMAVIRGATGTQQFEYLFLALMLVFLLSASWMVAGQVLLTGSVDRNTMAGALALYLMLGMIWAVLYAIALEVWPDAISGIEAGPWQESLAETVYFSFVTLTTLGYGDITPARPLTEILVVLEAVIGMFYIAVIVASLVGSFRFREKD